MSSEIWKIERDLCRCCHAEGVFINLAEPRGLNDQKEVYSDMLKECLDIIIDPVPGLLCEPTYTICEACILRLKDAFDFKRQVLVCEVKFKDLYNKSAIKVENDDSSDVVIVEVPESLSDFKEDSSNIDEIDDFITLDNEEVIKDIKSPKEDSSKTVKEKSKAKAKPKPNNLEPKGKRSGKAVNADKKKAEKKGSQKGDVRTDPSKNLTLLENEDGTLLFSCNTCEKTFKKRDLFIQHYRKVHLKLRRKLHSCYLCCEKIASHLRAAHLEDKHGVPAPMCGACGRKFAFPNQVLRHQKIYHMGEKKFECADCGRRFASKDLLAQHVVSHSTLRTFMCQFCNKAFKRAKNLKTHVMIHLNDKRQTCTLCKEAFVQVSSLKYHIMKRHPEAV